MDGENLGFLLDELHIRNEKLNQLSEQNIFAN